MISMSRLVCAIILTVSLSGCCLPGAGCWDPIFGCQLVPPNGCCPTNCSTNCGTSTYNNITPLPASPLATGIYKPPLHARWGLGNRTVELKQIRQLDRRNRLTSAKLRDRSGRLFRDKSRKSRGSQKCSCGLDGSENGEFHDDGDSCTSCGKSRRESRREKRLCRKCASQSNRSSRSGICNEGCDGCFECDEVIMDSFEGDCFECEGCHSSSQFEGEFFEDSSEFYVGEGVMVNGKLIPGETTYSGAPYSIDEPAIWSSEDALPTYQSPQNYVPPNRSGHGKIVPDIMPPDDGIWRKPLRTNPKEPSYRPMSYRKKLEASVRRESELLSVPVPPL